MKLAQAFQELRNPSWVAASVALGVATLTTSLATAAPFTMSADGSEVTDGATDLVWKRCSEGQHWNGKNCAGTALTLDHESALARARDFAADTGVAWRLPADGELTSILTDSAPPVTHPKTSSYHEGESAFIDHEIFPDTPARPFWTSTTEANRSGAFAVWFGVGGGITVFHDSGEFFARLVRSVNESPARSSGTPLPGYATGVYLSNATQVICEIQERLANLDFAPGSVNGRLGNKTQSAIDVFLSEIGPTEAHITLLFIRDELRSHESVVTGNPGQLEQTPSLSRPSHGAILFDDGEKAEAPLEVKTAGQGYDYFLKLSQIDTDEPVRTIYLRGGDSMVTKVPLGTFVLKYAAGRHWFGQACLFGIDTQLNKADRALEFTRAGDEVKGFSINLIRREGGNLSTKQLLAEDW